jgi:type I restriction enzyme, S subunit
VTAKPKENGPVRSLDLPRCPITGTELPSEWRICQIKEAYQFTSKPRGLSLENEAFVPFLPMEQIPIGRPYAETYEKKLVENLTSGTYVENGDLLVAKITPSFENGKQAVVKWDLPCGYATTEVIPLQAIEAIGDRDFLAHLLLHPEVRSNLAGKMDGTTGRQRLSKETLGSRLMALPPLPEQKKIAHILSTVQRAIEEQERIIQTTTELKKALMHKLFTEGVRNEPQKQTEIGLIPENWELVELGDVIRLFAGFAFKSQEGVKDTNTQLLRMGNLYQNTLDLGRSPIFYPDSFAATYKRFILEEGDLVMSLTGTSGKEDYGFTVRIPETGKSLLLNQRVTRIDITDNRLQKDFAHQFLLSRKFLDFLYPTAKGMKQANLSTNAMKKLKVVLPDKQEQNEIAACFKSLDQKIVVTGPKVAALQELFRTLLNELMTAKIRA